jgi:hypothetical protein
VFFHVFFMIFSKIICLFFFNIELVKNYNYNKAKSFGESVVVFLTKHMDCYSISLNSFLFYFIGESSVVFLTKHCQLLQRFSSLVFFLPKLSLLVFFYIYIKLVENLAKSCGESSISFLPKHCGLLQIILFSL